MFTAAEMAQHQADAESLMTLTVEASVAGPTGEIAEGDLARRPAWVRQGTSRAKVQTAGRQPQGRTANVGGSERTVMEGGLHLPVGSYLDAEQQLLIRVGWRFTVVDLDPTLDDPALRGQTYQVVEILKKSRMTARRLDVVEV